MSISCVMLRKLMLNIMNPRVLRTNINFKYSIFRCRMLLFSFLDPLSLLDAVAQASGFDSLSPSFALKQGDRRKFQDRHNSFLRFPSILDDVIGSVYVARMVLEKGTMLLAGQWSMNTKSYRENTHYIEKEIHTKIFKSANLDPEDSYRTFQQPLDL